MDEKANAKIKKLEEQIAKKKALIQRTKGRLREKERKLRTRRLIQVGGLAEIANIDKADKGAILGGMLEIAEIFEDKGKYQALKSIGDEVLFERERKRKTSQKAKNKSKKRST
ncbi:conjugal transfer protein TraD [Oligoflexia bacterium]|nr:conjugal transfer protein TraD [Oligoflexia bacterium]